MTINNFVKECAQDERLTTVFKKSKREGRGNLEEIVLKFFAYFERRGDFRHSVKDFLNEYMEIKTKKFSNANDLRSLFSDVLDVLVEALPGGVVRSDRPNTTPLLLFEAVSVGVADVIADGANVNAKALQGVLDDQELKKVTSGGTNSNPKLLRRIEIVREAVEN